MEQARFAHAGFAHHPDDLPPPGVGQGQRLPEALEFGLAPDKSGQAPVRAHLQRVRSAPRPSTSYTASGSRTP